MLEMDEREHYPNINHNKVLDRVGRNLLRTCIEAAAAPYYLLYDRNTKTPILNIARAASDEHVEPLLRSWFETKSREAQYVQVAVQNTYYSMKERAYFYIGCCCICFCHKHLVLDRS